jgi:PAS domain S-box-containing protein
MDAARFSCLLLADNPGEARRLAGILEGGGLKLALAGSGEAAAAAIREAGPAGGGFSLALIDLDLGVDGGAKLAAFLGSVKDLPFVFLCGGPDSPLPGMLEASGALGIIRKDSSPSLFLASVHLLLAQAGERKRLRAEEARWTGVLASAPDFIFALDLDRKVTWVNRPGNVAPGSPSTLIGKSLYEAVAPESLPVVTAAVEGVLADGRPRSYRAQTREFGGRPPRWYETYLGPIRASGRITGATLVSRDVTDDVRLAAGLDLPLDARTKEVEGLMSGFDYEPLRRILERFCDMTGYPIGFVAANGEALVSTRWQRVCAAFFRAHPDTRNACVQSDLSVLDSLAEGGREAFAEYRCPHGLRELARPLLVDGVRWATIFIGQFYYADEPPDDGALRLQAARMGWDEADFLAAAHEAPVYSREDVLKAMAFAVELGDLLAGLALAVSRERRLAHQYRIADEARAESERRYRLVAENAGDVIWTLDPATLRFTYMSPAITALRGLSPEEALAEALEESLTPASRDKLAGQIEERVRWIAQGDPRGEGTVTDLYEQPVKGGGTRIIEVTTKPVLDEARRVVEFVGVSRDATQRVKDEEALKEALLQKELLFGELQHRVKNSLSLIASLLSLEAASLSDGAARGALEASMGRIGSIALLYEQLYRSSSVSSILLDGYLKGVADALIESLTEGPGKLVMDYELAPEWIDTKRAVSLGLILNELLVNSIKYGCPRGEGRISVELRVEGPDLVLTVSDGGPGLPAGFKLPSLDWDGGSLGLTLVAQLSGQLKGSFSAGAGPGGKGAAFTVRFPCGDAAQCGKPAT